MAVRFKLGYYSPVSDDPLNREHVGYFPRMTEEEAWTAGRGVWKANKDRLSREKFALIIGDGRVCAVAEIHGVSVHEDRIAVDGEVLAEGHPVRDAWIGVPDPVVNASQNPVGYCDLPQEAQFRERPCGCGCGEISTRDFLPGHDVRAFQDRVRTMFAGSALQFFRWVDTTAAEHGLPLLDSSTRATVTADDPDDEAADMNDVVPFGIIDAHADAEKWPSSPRLHPEATGAEPVDTDPEGETR